MLTTILCIHIILEREDESVSNTILLLKAINNKKLNISPELEHDLSLYMDIRLDI